MSALASRALQESVSAQFPVLEQQLRQLSANKDKWLSVSIAERIAILEEMRAILWQPGFVQDWVYNTSRQKGFDPLDPKMAPLLAEEWLMYDYQPNGIPHRLTLAASKEEHEGIVLPSLPVTEKNGRKLVRTFPHPLCTSYETMAFPSFTVDLVLQDGKPTTQSSAAKQRKGRVCLILAAGNFDANGPIDALHKLYSEQQVCMVKYNPVNEHCAFFCDRVLEPLINTKGNMEESRFLSSHALVETMHLTGSDKTYNAIVWGPGAQAVDNIKAGKKLNQKPFTCELGAVSPYIIAPGTEPWTEAALLHHAKALATSAATNGGFICASPKALILPASWPQRCRFMELLETCLKGTVGHAPYYPGADTRQAAFLQKYGGQVKVISADVNAPKALPHLLITNVAAKEGEYALMNEAWTQLLSEVPLDVPLDRFLPAAVEVANNKAIVWGTLSATVIAGPSVPTEQVDAALLGLRYGAVGLNIWGGMIALFPSAVWGGYPGARPEDIQSGVDMVLNTFCYDHPEKAILRTPFVSPNHPGAQKPSPLVSQRLVWFLSYPSISTLTKVIAAATVGI